MVPVRDLDAPKKLNPLTFVRSAAFIYISGGNWMITMHPADKGTGSLNETLNSAFS
jgi:hypothetical protein